MSLKLHGLIGCTLLLFSGIANAEFAPPFYPPVVSSGSGGHQQSAGVVEETYYHKVINQQQGSGGYQQYVNGVPVGPMYPVGGCGGGCAPYGGQPGYPIATPYNGQGGYPIATPYNGQGGYPMNGMPQGMPYGNQGMGQMPYGYGGAGQVQRLAPYNQRNLMQQPGGMAPMGTPVQYQLQGQQLPMQNNGMFPNAAGGQPILNPNSQGAPFVGSQVYRPF